MGDNEQTYSQKDLRDAAEFRHGVHREALARVRRVFPDASSVVDRYPADAYFRQVWDYPGAWYTIVAIPEPFNSREALIETIVRDTIDDYRRGEGTRTGSVKKQTGAGASETLPKAQPLCMDDPFYGVLAAYPDCAVEYRIVPADPSSDRGYAAHWQALSSAFRTLFSDDGEGWNGDPAVARGTPIDAAALFAKGGATDRLNYRKAFLYPPHTNGYTDADFAYVNASLFPNGTDGLEVYTWTTDWSDYFDDGREWWGTLCLTVYDKSLDRFAVILASATD